MSTQPRGELDLAITNLDLESQEAQVSALLKSMPGVTSARIQQGGAYIHYREESITHGEIVERLRREGFKAHTFQDAPSGETGKASR